LKDTYYFPHDYNASNDQRVLKLRARLGNEKGYGIYFMILEAMAQENTGILDSDCMAELSLSYGLAIDELKAVLDFAIKVGLFIQDERGIFSKRMLEHKELRKKYKKDRSEAGKRGATTRWGNSSANSSAIAKPMANDSKGKERKGKESKGNNITNNNTTLFLETFNKSFESNYRPTESRTKKLAERLKGFTLQEILQAVENMSQSPFHRGVNDRGWKADPDFILRNDEQIDKFINYEPEQAKELARKVSSVKQNNYGKPSGGAYFDEGARIRVLQGNGGR